MKNLFYSTRLDKSGNKLMTSYTNEKMRDKFGGKDATRAETLYFVHFRDNGTALVHEDVDGPIVRSLLVNSTGSQLESGRFELWGKTTPGGWQKTPFSFSQYGNANAAMKAMVGMYDAMMITTFPDDNQDGGYSDERSDGMNSEYEVTGEI